MRYDLLAMSAGPDPKALERVLARHAPGARVLQCDPLGGSGADAGLARKEGGYARPWRVTTRDGVGRVRTFVYRTQRSDEFGHDRRADRAANMLLAFDAFAAIPDHVRALDVGFEAPGGLRTLVDAGEPYLLTTWAEGELYAEDLRRVAAEQAASPGDLARCEALAQWLVALHAERVDDPVAWRRAVRDLLGHGEGIFGIVDAYGEDVPAAPPSRLAGLEEACLRWRWRLRGRPERLRRTHGDFHPFNLVFSQGTRFTVLDASRGCKGDPADDVTALSVNYLFFALEAGAEARRAFATLWRTFWLRYLDGMGSGEVLESAAPFLAWRALVLGCPRFYPDLSLSARDALLTFAEQALASDAFDPRTGEELLA
jgi:aminoglycoside phosphotransferase (APT) family kinase protein